VAFLAPPLGSAGPGKIRDICGDCGDLVVGEFVRERRHLTPAGSHDRLDLCGRSGSIDQRGTLGATAVYAVAENAILAIQVFSGRGPSCRRWDPTRSRKCSDGEQRCDDHPQSGSGTPSLSHSLVNIAYLRGAFNYYLNSWS
jgi:hypothetical protein